MRSRIGEVRTVGRMSRLVGDEVRLLEKRQSGQIFGSPERIDVDTLQPLLPERIARHNLRQHLAKRQQDVVRHDARSGPGLFDHNKPPRPDTPREARLLPLFASRGLESGFGTLDPEKPGFFPHEKTSSKHAGKKGATPLILRPFDFGSGRSTAESCHGRRHTRGSPSDSR